MTYRLRERAEICLSAAQPSTDAAYHPGSSAISRSLNHNSLWPPGASRNQLKPMLENRDEEFQNGTSNAPLNRHGVTVNKRVISAVGAFFLVLALVLALALGAPAQITVGDKVNMNLTGSASFGYTGDYGNQEQSDHGLTAGGTGDLSGSYYNPDFISFHVQPYYNQSRANSDSQSITDSSGVNASAAIFSGSNFPGSISYSKNYNSEGSFGVPGIANYTSHGNGDVFSAGWAINVPSYPHLQLSFQDGTSNNSIYGTDSNANVHYDSFGVNTNYRLAGYSLNGGYRYVKTQSQIPEIVSGQAAEEDNSSGGSFYGNLSHSLPWNGSFSAGASRSNTSQESMGGNFNSTFDTLTAGVGFVPFANFGINSNVMYNDNLAGSLYSTVVAAGGVVENTPQQGSHSLDVVTYVLYQLPSFHLTFRGTLEDREQSFFGSTISDNAISGSVSYSNTLLGGFVNATSSVTENLIGNHTSLGLFDSVNYSRRLFGLNFSGGLNYEQNQQTVLITYSTSGYGYNATIGRKLGEKTYFNFSASGAKSGLTGNSGSQAFSQSYGAVLNLRRWVTLSSSYSKSSGNSILTGSGLVATPIPLPVVTPTSIILYGGHSYSFGIGSSPIRRLTVSANYAQAFSDTTSTSLTSNNHTELVSSNVDYQFRQMHFIGGYTKLVQGFSASGTPPAMVGSFYIGVTRWFKFF